MDGMRERFVGTAVDLLDTDPRIAVVLADIGVALFRERGAMDRHPDRVINVGIREQLMVGVAAGLALEGLRPVVHSYTPFLVERPYEQIKLDFAHQGVGGVFVSIGGSYDAAGEGRTHQSPEDVALMATVPGMQVHLPGHPDEAEAILRRVVSGDGLHYVRLAARSNREARVGAARGELLPVRRGSTGTPVLVAVGPMLDPVLDAVGEQDVSVLYATTMRPFDAPTLRASVAADVVLVEPALEGTSSAVISAALQARPHRLLSIGVPLTEHRHYGTPADHDAALGLDAAGIRRRLEEFFGGRP